MSKISNGNLPKVLELRKKNGLEATEAAANADLEASKAKWTEKETPRYRAAGESPIFISGKYLTKEGVCPATGEKDAGRVVAAPTGAKRGRKAAKASEANELEFYRALAAKKFKIRMLLDELSGERTVEVPKEIEALNLKFGGTPGKGDESVYVSQTSPQVVVALTLEKFLELSKIKGQ